MRITLVISSLQRGGAERVMCMLATSWVKQRHDVTLLTFDHGAASVYPIHPAVKWLALGLEAESGNFFQGLFRNLKRISKLRRTIRRSNPDVVISFMDRINVLTLLATRTLGTTVIISERVDPALYDLGRVWSLLRSVTYHFADALVCQTQSALRRFQAKVKVPGYVIPNPVAVPQHSGEWLAGRSNDGAGHVVAAMGRLVPQKGFDLLLKAFAKVADRHADWSLVIMGQGPLKAELEKQVSDLKLSGRVQLPGAVSNPFAAFCEADLFVLSSRFEGFANVLCEAMACGLPVISFDCPSGPADIIRHGVDGILVPLEDTDALAAAMDCLMEDEAERSRLASNAPEVLNRFSEATILSMWQHLFESLLSTSDGVT